MSRARCLMSTGTADEQGPLWYSRCGVAGAGVHTSAQVRDAVGGWAQLCG
jgi:hypothetical protein